MSKQKDKHLEQKIRELSDQLASAKREQKERKGKKLIHCSHCAKNTAVNKWTIIYKHFYVSPYGCTGGDYWKFSEDVYLICPKCEGLTRAYNPSGSEECLHEDISLTKQWGQISHASRYTTQQMANWYRTIDDYDDDGLFAERLDYYGDYSWYVDVNELREEKRKKQEQERHCDF